MAIGIATFPLGPDGPHTLSFALVPQTVDLTQAARALGSENSVSKIPWDWMRYILFRANSFVRMDPTKLGESMITLVTENLGFLDLAGTIDSEKTKVILNCGALFYEGMSDLLIPGVGSEALALYLVPQIRLAMLVAGLFNASYDCYRAVEAYDAKVTAENQLILAERERERQQAQLAQSSHLYRKRRLKGERFR